MRKRVFAPKTAAVKSKRTAKRASVPASVWGRGGRRSPIFLLRKPAFLTYFSPPGPRGLPGNGPWLLSRFLGLLFLSLLSFPFTIFHLLAIFSRPELSWDLDWARVGGGPCEVSSSGKKFGTIGGKRETRIRRWGNLFNTIRFCSASRVPPTEKCTTEKNAAFYLGILIRLKWKQMARRTALAHKLCTSWAHVAELQQKC